MGCFDEVKESGRRCKVVALVIYSVVFAIYSIVMSSLAFSRFDSATGEFIGLISNWEKAPISAFELSSTSTCSVGYTLLGVPTWPGTYSDACACASGAYSNKEQASQYSDDSASCDVNQTDAGCIDQPKIGSVSLDVWRGKYICFKREGEAQMLSKTALRPVPSAAGTCPNGYQACGDGTMESDRTTCQPTTSSCPATGATADTSTPSGYAAASAIATSDTTSWFTRVSYAGEMPINEVTLALWDPDGKRGDCYGSGADQSSYVGSGRSYDYANDYPSECTRRDIRWEVLDLNAESEVLSANFDLQPSCTDTTDKLDYISTGTKCGTTPTSDPDCSVYGESSSFGECSTTDTTCTQIVYQSKCGALQRWASQADEYFAVLFKREVYWKPTCSVSILDLKAAEEPVEHIKEQLLLNLILNILANLLIGVFFPVCIFQNEFYGNVECIPGEGAAEKKLIEWNKKYLNLIFHLVKIYPAVVAIMTYNAVSGPLDKADAENCSDDGDDRTSDTFSELTTEMAASIDSLTNQVVVDCLTLLAALVMSIYALVKSKKIAPDPDGTDEPVKSQELEEMAQGEGEIQKPEVQKEEEPAEP